MPRYHGTITVQASSLGKTLTLMRPNPTPPPANLDVVAIENPPAWLWEIAVGNVGRSMTIDVDNQTPSNPVAAGVS